MPMNLHRSPPYVIREEVQQLLDVLAAVLDTMPDGGCRDDGEHSDEDGYAKPSEGEQEHRVHE